MTKGGFDEYIRYDSADFMGFSSSQRRHERYI